MNSLATKHTQYNTLQQNYSECNDSSLYVPLSESPQTQEQAMCSAWTWMDWLSIPLAFLCFYHNHSL